MNGIAPALIQDTKMLPGASEELKKSASTFSFSLLSLNFLPFLRLASSPLSSHNVSVFCSTAPSSCPPLRLFSPFLPSLSLFLASLFTPPLDDPFPFPQRIPLELHFPPSHFRPLLQLTPHLTPLHHGPKDNILIKKTEVPMHRLGHPTEIAETVLWMVKTGFVTSKVVGVDGGMFRQ